jgi:hypothetical protein
MAQRLSALTFLNGREENRAVAVELKVAQYYSERSLFSMGLFNRISWTWEGDRLYGSSASPVAL